MILWVDDTMVKSVHAERRQYINLVRNAFSPDASTMMSIQPTNLAIFRIANAIA